MKPELFELFYELGKENRELKKKHTGIIAFTWKVHYGNRKDAYLILQRIFYPNSVPELLKEAFSYDDENYKTAIYTFISGVYSEEEG